MFSKRWLLVLSLASVYAQEPRKRYLKAYEDVADTDADIGCPMRNCDVKRAGGEDELGPFWANRGKKDPTFSQSRFYAEEPSWILVRRDDKTRQPFYITRGKKKTELYSNYLPNNLLVPSVKQKKNDEIPFYVSRG